MTRIDFYSLKEGSTSNRLTLTCRLVERIRAAEQRILIYCPEFAIAEQLDRLLWVFRDGSFLPHGLINKVDVEFTPVLISTEDHAAGEHQVLINLSFAVPACFNQFERVCEPLDRQPDILAAGRERWKFYQAQGCLLQHNSVAD